MNTTHPHPVERELDKLRKEVSSHENARLKEQEQNRLRMLFG